MSAQKKNDFVVSIVPAELKHNAYRTLHERQEELILEKYVKKYLVHLFLTGIGGAVLSYILAAKLFNYLIPVLTISPMPVRIALFLLVPAVFFGGTLGILFGGLIWIKKRAQKYLDANRALLNL